MTARLNTAAWETINSGLALLEASLDDASLRNEGESEDQAIERLANTRELVHQAAADHKLPLIGRARWWMDKLTKEVRDGRYGPHHFSKTFATTRGSAFEVQLRDKKGERVGYIARVEVTLDRMDES